MRPARRLFATLCSPEHLERAATLAARDKRRRRDVSWFLFCREDELARLRDELRSERYQPRPYQRLIVRDPKPRLIARAPFRDRVVHRAVVLAVAPALLRSARAESFACRAGRGTHRALLRLLALMRRHRFAMHLDVRSYYASVDLGILRRLLRERLRDRPLLRLIDRILERGRGLHDSPAVRVLAGLDPDWPPRRQGLPLGAVTSQLFAGQLYLDAFDQFVKRELRVPGYVRYVDDMFVFGSGRGELRAWRGAIGAWLERERRLRLKHPRARILSCHGHLDALGYRVRRDGLEALPRAWRRMQARVAVELERPAGRPARVDIARSLASSAGLLLF